MGTIPFKGDPNRILWSDKSPEPGTPTCLCSYCGAMIPEHAMPLRLFDTRTGLEARFCDPCAGECFGLVVIPDDGEIYAGPQELEPNA
jgi:hypothetical protein